MGAESFLTLQILDFAEGVGDRVAALLQSGAGITLTYDDEAGTLTIANTGLGGSTGSTDNRILRADGTGGATVQNSAVTIADNGDVSGVRILTTTSDVQAGNDVYCALNRFIGGLGAQGIQFKSSATIATHVGASGRFCLGSDTSAGTALKNSSGTLQVRLGDDSAFANISFALGFVGTYTVATLPSAAANAGALAQVTDSSVTTNGSAVSGGGANRVVVFSNGSTWDVVVA